MKRTVEGFLPTEGFGPVRIAVEAEDETVLRILDKHGARTAYEITPGLKVRIGLASVEPKLQTRYRVQAVREGGIQVPTFELDANLLGIVSEEHAERIARVVLGGKLTSVTAVGV